MIARQLLLRHIRLLSLYSEPVSLGWVIKKDFDGRCSGLRLGSVSKSGPWQPLWRGEMFRMEWGVREVGNNLIHTSSLSVGITPLHA